MKLGLGLYRHQLDDDHLKFARQCGCTHVVAHLVDYFREGQGNQTGDQPIGGTSGWGRAGDGKPWAYDELAHLVDRVRRAGLVLEAIENFDPSQWHDVLLDGPRRQQQLDTLAEIVRATGRAGIPIYGYNFSIAGVAGRIKGPFARGGAQSVGMHGTDDTPIPNGTVWNMVYDVAAPAGTLAPITHEELWRRLGGFLDVLLPVAEQANVRLAAHPDDPPLEFVRGQPRLVHRLDLYQRLLDRRPSHHNALEFCVGTLAEMPDPADLYEAVDHYSRQGAVAYVHCRNVHGKAPQYRETFIDDGDVDMIRVLRILHENGYSGVVIPDHAPQLTCAAPWHAGMAYTCGWLRAAIDRVMAGA
jgi:mannonate dehydratase